MTPVVVEHVTGDRFEVVMRGHRIVVDQPRDAGGEDGGPTPTEIFVGSLASCVAFFARRYLARHGLDDGDLRVEASYELSESRPARVTRIAVTLQTAALPEGPRRDALLRAVDRCTVHNSLREAPRVDIRLAAPAPTG